MCGCPHYICLSHSFPLPSSCTVSLISFSSSPHTFSFFILVLLPNFRSSSFFNPPSPDEVFVEISLILTNRSPRSSFLAKLRSSFRSKT
ncbi:hypothetical protein BVRB_5g113050 [Beta vulgaris subsp. vulgaris]|nr:hypothetical protein BVRB_5g113050 [Beta vulgaris subsp. vulgaris]